MPEINQFLPPLVGGFFFSLWYYPTAYWAARLTGYRLLFATIGSAALLVFCAQLIFIVSEGVPWFQLGRSWVREHFPYPNSDLSLFAIVLMPVMLLLGQAARLIPRLHPDTLSRQILMSDGGAVTQAIIESLDQGTALLVTLTNEKVYTGTVSMNLNRTRQPESIRLVVERSGYRDPRTKHVTLDIPYSDTHHELVEELDSEYEAAIANAIERVAPVHHSFDETVRRAMEFVYDEIGSRPHLEEIASLFTVTIPLSEVRSLAPHRKDIFERFQTRLGVAERDS